MKAVQLLVKMKVMAVKGLFVVIQAALNFNLKHAFSILNNAIPVIPLEYIKNWLEHSTILSEESLEGTPYIVGAADQRVIAGKGQTVYARGEGIEVGQRYAIYREGEPYIVTDDRGKTKSRSSTRLRLLQPLPFVVKMTCPL